jgi:hypothetical protein
MVGFTRSPCEAGVIEATRCFDAPLSQGRKRLTLVATIIGSAMALLDGSVVNVALPAIQQALHADAAVTQWIVNAYLLPLGALVLIGGRSLRPASDFCAGHRGLHCCLHCLRALAERWHAHPEPRRSGSWRRPVDAR